MLEADGPASEVSSSKTASTKLLPLLSTTEPASTVALDRSPPLEERRDPALTHAGEMGQVDEVMCRQVTVHEAKTHLSRLLVEVEEGASIVTTRSGKPLAKLVGIEAVERRPGRLKGKIRMARDFEAPLPESCSRRFRCECE